MKNFFQCLAGAIPLFLTPEKIGLLKTYNLDISNRKAKNEETLENLYVFRSFYLLFFRTLQHVREKKMIDTRLSLTKNAFPLYLYPFIVFHISVLIREVLRQICSAGATNFAN